MGLVFWPILRDGWNFRHAVRQVEALQVTRAVPDLTGKVVAFLSNDTRDTDAIFECTDLLNHSGAAKIYLLARKSSWSYDRLDPDWRGEVDLTHWVLGEAVPVRPSWRSPDEPALCALGPTESGIERIDYFIARDIGFHEDNAPQGFVPQSLLRDYSARLDEYFAPISDPHAFRITPEAADLVRIRIAGRLEGFPRPFSQIYRGWPPVDQDMPDYSGPVKAALCRHAATDCGRF